MSKQKNIQLGQVLLPEIKYNKTIYYPLTYVFEKVLLKSRQSTSKLEKNGYDKSIKKLPVDYSFNNAGLQTTNCISKDGLIKMLSSSYIGGLNVNQRKSMNLLLNYLGLNVISEKPRFLDVFNYDSDEYSYFEKDCIRETFKLEHSLTWQKCSKCNKYYPIHTNFFSYNTRDKIMGSICHTCIQDKNIIMTIHPDKELNLIAKQYGETAYIAFRDHNVVGIYDCYLNNNLLDYPHIIKNKEDYLKIIKYLYDCGRINKDTLTISYLVNTHKLSCITTYLKSREIYTHLFDNHPNEYPWQYKKYSISTLTMDEAVMIFNNYLEYHEIVIKDIYNFNYSEIVTKSKLHQFNTDILGFIMEYHNNKYPAYKFGSNAINYWKDKNNRNKALKYLIEEDMKLDLEKIPLYLTLTSIRSIGRTTMYTILKKYYSSLYEWVNDVYPNVFDPKDFDINYMRNEFDSMEEQVIHDVLKKNFVNVTYNSRNADCTIELVGKFPDWFIFTEKGCIIVEYFGLWDRKRESYNSRTKNYVASSKDKINKYKTLSGYKFLYIYPEDIDNNFEGLNNKMKEFL